MVHTFEAGFGLVVTGKSVQTTVKGGVCDFELLVNNTTPTSHVFDVFVDDNVWPADAPSRTGRLRPRQTASFHVVVSVPLMTRRAIDRVVVSIRSDTDGFTRQAVDLECSVPVEKMRPVVRKTPKRKQVEPAVTGEMADTDKNVPESQNEND